MARDVRYARSSMGTVDLSRSTWRTLCLNNRNYVAISHHLLYACLSTVAVLTSLLAGVCG
jgi:hypothetical protein